MPPRPGPRAGASLRADCAASHAEGQQGRNLGGRAAQASRKTARPPVDRRLVEIRTRSFQASQSLDAELIALVGDDRNNAFLTNPAIHTVYQYLVAYVCSLAAAWFETAVDQLEVLDWGAGKGHITFLLDRHGARVTAADRDQGLGDSTFDQSTPIIGGTGIEVVKLTHDHVLPFDDASFDVVVSMGVLEHVPNDLESLREIRRVLRPCGLFFCFFLPYTLSWTQRVGHLMGNHYHDRLYSERMVQRLLDGAGLVLLDRWHRQLFPKNSVRYVGYRHFERADQWITSHTPLGRFATNLEFVAAKFGDPEGGA
jgi:SAM-dependent methyltransferase